MGNNLAVTHTVDTHVCTVYMELISIVSADTLSAKIREYLTLNANIQ